MTIYDAIKARLDAGEKEVPVTCILSGKGFCRFITEQDGDPKTSSSIHVKYLACKNDYDYYEKNGKAIPSDLYPSLALGHHEGQVATAQAIKDQAFDTET